MRVAVLGAGAIGLGSTALAVLNGHQATVWSRSLPHGPATITSTGAVAGDASVTVAGLDAAVRDADAILFALPGWGHRAAIEAIAPLLTDGQSVLIGSHCSFGAMLLRRLLDARACRAGVCAWGTTVVTGRRTGPLACSISNVRGAIDAAGDGVTAARTLFGDRFVERSSLLAIQLSNVNPQNHLALLLCNLTRAELGEAWGNYWAITPAVGRLMEALDTERLALADHLGVAVRTLREHFHLSFDVPMGPVWEQAAAVHARGKTPFGPTSLDTRYISEDIPYGIAATERLALLAGIPVPLHAGGASLFSALVGRDLRAENDLLPLVLADIEALAGR